MTRRCETHSGNRLVSGNSCRNKCTSSLILDSSGSICYMDVPNLSEVQDEDGDTIRAISHTGDVSGAHIWHTGHRCRYGKRTSDEYVTINP